MRHQHRKPGSFADLVRAARFAPREERTTVEPWPQPISDGHWTDEAGTYWQIRGRRASLSRPALRRLLKLAGLRVLHARGPEPIEVSGPEREALMERVEQYFAGEAPPHSAFRLAEFRNGDRAVMLVIEEAC